MASTDFQNGFVNGFIAGSTNININTISKVNTEEAWIAENPVLPAGEIVAVTLEDGSTKLKVGNGETAYSDLSYIDEPTTAKLMAIEDNLETAETKLETIEEGATKTVVDKTLNVESTNAIENKAVALAINEVSENIPTELPASGGNADTVDGKHADEFANAEHEHEQYALKTDVSSSNQTLQGSITQHAENTDIHVTLDEKAAWNNKSDFSGNYNDLNNKPEIPSIEGLASESYVNSKVDSIELPSYLSELNEDAEHRVVSDIEKATWNAKSDFSGSYNDLTDQPAIPSIEGLASETFVNNAVSTKADSEHNHNELYDSKGSASTAETNAKSYTDNKFTTLVGESSVTTQVSGHNTSNTSHNDIRILISELSEKLNKFLDVTDEKTDELSEVLQLIENNKGSLESLTSTKINVSDIVTNLETNLNNKVLSASQGVAIKTLIDALDTEIDKKANASHTHGISEVTNLQSTLDNKSNVGHSHNDIYYTETEVNTLLSGKAEASHGTHVSFSNTAPVMDGTASVGSATSVARSDHKHPTDTSRASQTDLTSHTGDTTKHITSTERTNWNAAKTHADSTHAPTNAEKNQNAFSNIKAGSTTISADTTTDTIEFVAGSNITLTPDATNDKLTISATNTTYNAASQSASGLMSAADKAKLDGIATGANKITVDSTLSSTSTNPVQNKIVHLCLSGKVDKEDGKSLSTNDYTTTEKNKLAGIASGANAYTHPTSTGNKHIPSGGSSGQILRWSSDGTAVWGADNNTTYSAATTSAAGLMSAADKTKLNGIATGANAYSHPTTSGNKHIPSGGSSGQILRWSADGTAAWGADNNTTYGVVTSSADGLTPKADASAGTISSQANQWVLTRNGTAVDWYKLPANAFNNSTYSLSSFGITSTANELNQLHNTYETKTGWKVSTKGTLEFEGMPGETGTLGLTAGSTYTLTLTKLIDGEVSTDAITCTAIDGADAVGIAGIVCLMFADINFSVYAKLSIDSSGNPVKGNNYYWTTPMEISDTRIVSLVLTGNGITKTYNTPISELPINISGYAQSLSGLTHAVAEVNYMLDNPVGRPYTDADGEIYGEIFNDYSNNIASGYYSHAEGLNTKTTGDCSHAEGQGTEAGDAAHAEGVNTKATGSHSHAEGESTIASGYNSHAEGHTTTSSHTGSHSEGVGTTSSNYGSHASGRYNKTMTSGDLYNTQIGDVFVVGNGTGGTSNAFRITYKGEIYGTKAFNSSGADYAEFIYPWHDDNIEDEDRVGYFTTFKNGKLYKATSKDIILGVTSGNPSIVGNADEDYYWRYERDEFNRIVLEDVEEEIQKVDEEGKLIFDENNRPVMEKTGNIIKNGRMKLSEDYDPTLQDSYIERKNRKEWDYVGMLGILPTRDDGTCIPGQYCKCNDDGIATLATAEDVVTNRFTFVVLERISDNVVKIVLK